MGFLDFLFRRSRPAREVRPQRLSGTGETTSPLLNLEVAQTDLFAKRRARRDQFWPQWLQSLGHPYELVPGAEAEAAYNAARVSGQISGFCPLIVEPGLDTPVRSEPINLKNSKVRTASEYFEIAANVRIEDTDDLALFDTVDELTPGPPAGLDIRDLLSNLRPFPRFTEVAILRLPCAETWKIPFYLHVGAPLDQSDRSLGEEIGVEKQWYDRFGAELCCIGERSWQFKVARPPRNHAEAVELLREHYLYAWVDDAYDADIIANSAAQLRVNTHWRFDWV
jgi:hypothetical protein